MTKQAPDQLFVEFQAAVAGRYSLQRELGRGGMGVVYLAQEVRLDRPVAIKLLPPEKARDSRLRERFLREARTAAKLSHPHIIPIFAVDEAAGFVFFAMAHVPGVTLTERVSERGPLAASEAARLLREVAWALDYAHSQGIVHRDVKPDNVMLEDGTGRTLVGDFGIAGAVSDAAGLDAREVIGTPAFMSPEQALGEHIDGRSDLYALGAVGYYALSGKLLFEASTPTDMLAKQVTEPAPPVSRAAAVPHRLASAIDRCLAKDPADRPQTAASLADQLGAVLDQRRELPVGIQVFVKRQARLGGMGGLIYVCSIPFIVGIVGELLGRAAAGWAFLGALTIVPVGLLVNRARRFLRAGFSPRELGPAFRAVLERGREERVFEFGRGPSLQERVLWLLCVAGITSAGGAGLILLNTTYPSLTYPLWLRLMAIVRWSSVVAALSGFFAVVQLQRRIDLDTRIWSWLWQGPMGRLLFRIARWFVPSRGLPAPATHRATELALAMAAEQLFDQLPRETRSHLRDLPDVVRRLEGDAQRLRRRLDELQDALAGPTTRTPDALAARRDRVVAELERERDLVQARLGEGVRALEAIRLNLLRLHAGSGNVESLTTDLGSARSVAEEMGRQLAARQAVDEALR